MFFKKICVVNVVSLILVTSLCYGICLFNDFVGDDEVLIVNNSFYNSWKNLPYLFSKTYITDGNSLFFIPTHKQYFHSGSVAYRPVLSATFFLDHWLWGLHPFGYHLTNLLLHIVNTILVYFLFCYIIQNVSIAFFSALLFGLHPVHVEAVSNIGYRADVLSCFFMLCSFLLFIKFYRVNSAIRRYFLYICSIVFYLLGLFSKEAVIVLPMLIFLYDIYLQPLKIDKMISHLIKRYLGYIIVTIFYLYIYLKVFPNSTLGKISLIGGNIFIHITTIFEIFKEYLLALAIPLYVKILPPLYAPIPQTLITAQFLVSVIVFIIFIFLIYKIYWHDKRIALFLSFFLISLIPVSNIIPIVTPMAHRFLYIPSIWFIGAIGCFLEHLTTRYRQLTDVIKIGIIVSCIFVSFHIIKEWKTDISVGLSLIQYYPDNQMGYSILGTEYFRQGNYDMALPVLKKSVSLGSKDPKIFYMLGLCDKQNAEFFLHYAISLKPDYVYPYIALGRLYFFQHRYKDAILYLKKSISIHPTYSGIGYLIKTYLNKGDYSSAVYTLHMAEKTYLDRRYIVSLKKMIDDYKRN